MTRKAAKPTPAFVPLALRPGFLVRRLNQIHLSLFFEECKAFDITPVQYGMLTALQASPGLDQKSLGLEVGLDRANTADVVKRLEARGLVKREQSAVDGRVKHVFITAEGKKIVKGMYADMIAAQERLLAPLPEAERQTFLELLRKLVDANNEFGRASMRAL